MKIAICINQSLLGGVGTSTFILASLLSEAGHKADIIVTHFNPGVGYERALNDKWPVKAISIGERWLRKRLENTLEVLSTYDVIINNHSIETSLVLPAIPRGITRISVVRSTDSRVIEKAKEESRYIDSLVGISPQVTDLLRSNSVYSSVVTIPNSILLVSKRLPTLSCHLRITYLGRLGKREKNILILPEIANELSKIVSNFTLTIIGDGRDREELERKIKNVGVIQYMNILGSLDREKAWNILKKSHFTLIPSLFEGFGLVVAESMAAGSIPICSDLPVFKWLLGKHSNLLTVPTSNPKAYASRIHELHKDPIQYHELQSNLVRRQKRLFSPEVMVKKYLQLIDDLKANNADHMASSVTISELPLSSYYRRRCSRVWKILQLIRYRVT